MTNIVWNTIRDDLRVRRERRNAERRLRSALADYRTPEEIDDLLALVDAQEAVAEVPEAAVIRDILSTNLRAYYAAQRGGAQRAVGF